MLFHVRQMTMSFLIAARFGLPITAPLGLQKVTAAVAPMEY